MSNFFVKLTSTLLITCAASVALVAGAHEGTKEIIAKKHEADTKAAYKQVLPDLGDLQKEKAPGDLISDIQKSSKGGKANGYIYTVDPSGYGGKIKLMVGIDAEKGTITGIKVLCPLTGGVSGYPILLRAPYAAGNLYVLTIPDDMMFSEKFSGAMQRLDELRKGK